MNTNTQFHTSHRRLIPLFLLIVLAGLYALAQYGCTNRINGKQFENKKPVVFFVNVPPDSLKVSRNPVINWIGTDADGQVKYFRYIVVRKDSLDTIYTAAQFASQILPTYDSTRWTYIQVTVDDPKTTNVVQMSADLNDPVRRFYPQYVFLQAFDDKGLGSDIVFKALLRNDNPPLTRIIMGEKGDTSNPYINSVLPGGAITGVQLRWNGADPIDYPKDPPPFQFQWKLFGPYQFTNSPTDTFSLLRQKFFKRVFLASDGLVYRVGRGERIIQIDSSLDSLHQLQVDTVIILVDTIRGSSALGSFDSMFVVDDTEFVNPTNGWYRLVDSSSTTNGSGWVSTAIDTFYDVFRLRRGTTTRQEKFIFWARCRDDAFVPDPVPAYVTFDVVDPHYERDIVVVDLTRVSPVVRLNAPWRVSPTLDTAKTYWDNVITKWAAGNNRLTGPDSIKWDKNVDYIYTNQMSDRVPLLKLLTYKLMILYNDDIQPSGISDGAGNVSQTIGKPIYTGIDAGVNAWLIMRVPIAQTAYGQPGGVTGNDLSVRIDAQYRRYFGVEAMVYSGWAYRAYDRGNQCNHFRAEDFIGGLSLDIQKFPNLAIDSALLHRRYRWRPIINHIDTCPGSPTYGNYAVDWRPDLAALPEVDWSVRSFGTEVLYLYQSKDSTGHPLGPLYSFHGAPCAHRLNRGLYRTAHFNFSPLGMDTVAAQVMADSMLNWLYNPHVAAPPTDKDYPYPDALVKISIDDARRNADAREEFFARQKEWEKTHPRSR
jgi:hypothetical protein